MWRKLVDPAYNQTTYFAESDAEQAAVTCDLRLPLLGLLHGKEGFEYRSYSGDYTIHAIQSGSATYYLDNKKYIKKAGDLFITWPGQKIHCIDNNDGTLLRYMWIFLKGPRTEWALAQCGFSKDTPQRAGGYNPHMKRLWENILQDFATGRTGTVHTATRAWELVRAMMPDAAAPGVSATGSLGSAVDYILRTSPLHQVSVNGLAEQLKMDRSTLCRHFNKEFGIPPKTYIDNRRLAYAEELLRTTRLRAAEVSYQCGFKDPCYFSRVFKERYGSAPGTWRKR